MSGSKIEYCVDCGEDVSVVRRRYVFRESKFFPICIKCSEGRGYKIVTKYNLRPLGYPKIQGGKQSPGKYEWSD